MSNIIESEIILDGFAGGPQPVAVCQKVCFQLFNIPGLIEYIHEWCISFDVNFVIRINILIIRLE